MIQAVTDHDGFGRRRVEELKRSLEDTGVRLHVAMVGRGERRGDVRLQLEMALKRCQTPMRIRDQTDSNACRVELLKGCLNVVVERKVLAGAHSL